MLVANSTITSVDRPAGPDDYDGPESNGNLWAGTEDAYFEQKTGRVTTGTGSNVERRWTLYLALAVPPVVIHIGDLLTFTQQQADGSTGTYQAPVLSDETRQQPDIPDDVQSRAYVLEPSSATGAGG